VCDWFTNDTILKKKQQKRDEHPKHIQKARNARYKSRRLLSVDIDREMDGMNAHHRAERTSGKDQSACSVHKKKKSRLPQSPSKGEPWHFLLALLCFILVAIPLEFHWR